MISIQTKTIISYLVLLLTTEFEVLATLDDKLMLALATGTFQTEDNLLSSFGLMI
jgi:hypothetical protein